MSQHQDTDPLLYTGSVHTPLYGFQDSSASDQQPPSSTASRSSRESVKHESERIWAVAVFSLTACLASLLVGMMIGYSSLTLLELAYISKNNKNATLGCDPSMHGIDKGSVYSSMFGAFGALGALFGGPVASPIADRFSRKYALMIGGVPTLIGWILIVFAHMSHSWDGFFAMLLLGRLLTGFGAGWFLLCVLLYIAEIASAKLRGFFSNCNQLFTTTGIFISYGLGLAGDPTENSDVCRSHFKYYHAAVIPIGIVVVLEILMIFLPQTPRWLYAHNKDQKGRKVLTLLRGKHANIIKEIDGIKKMIEKDQSMTIVRRFKSFQHRRVLIPFVIVLFLMFFQQFSGTNAVIFYGGSIFQQADVKNPQLVNALCIGLVQIFATIVSVVFVDYLGRKLLLGFSSIFMAISSVLLGVHFLVLNHFCHGCLGSNCTNPNGTVIPNPDTPCNSASFSGLAITAMIIFITTYSFGWGPIPWTSMSELLPLKVRSLAGSMASFVNWTFATIITAFFDSYAKGVSPKIAWWSFALISFLGLLFVIIFLPETKGHRLEEIEEHFEKGQIIAVKCACGERNRKEQEASYTA